MKRSHFLSLFATLLALPRLISAAESEEAVNLSAEFGAYTGTFVLYDVAKQRWVRFHPERCDERSSPCSTFKVPNTLIALETGVANGPDFSLPWDGKKRSIEAWNRDQTLRSAFAVSCVWYYQALAERVGIEKYREMLPKLGYGNADVSGGVTRFWLQSSLTISANEQVRFLRRLHARELPFSTKTVDTLLDIMTVERRGDTVFRGKTGSGAKPGTDDYSLGWFIGSVTSPAGEYYFATRITDGEAPSGLNARKITEAVLKKMGIW